MTPAVIFDFDGTIVDTEWPVYEAARVAHEEHGFELPIEEWVRIVGTADNKPLEERLRDLLGHEPDASIIERAKDEHGAVRHTAPMLPGVHEMLSAIAAAGRPMAIASSSPRSWVEPHLTRLGVVDAFAALSTRDLVDRGKPAPDLFLAAAAALELDPGGLLAIEDSRNGCIAAKAAGMTCVVVPNRVTRHDIPTEADLVIESLADFPFADFGLTPPA